MTPLLVTAALAVADAAPSRLVAAAIAQSRGAVTGASGSGPASLGAESGSVVLAAAVADTMVLVRAALDAGTARADADADGVALARDVRPPRAVFVALDSDDDAVALDRPLWGAGDSVSPASAEATDGPEKIATPTPSANAKPPTRPTKREADMTFSLQNPKT
ncbi:MAG: hypothetical protein NTY24_00660 [Mycobacterium sp.]|nr:hypothetical protein [Mycobacterium sp.]